MGIYSQNRVAGVAGNVDLTMESLDFTPDFSIGSVLEAVIQMHENDARMFDTLIECDFMEAENGFIMNEAEAAAIKEAADEKKTNGIVEKIKAAIEKFINFIQKTAGNLVAKFKDLVNSDKKIAERYKGILTVEKLEGFKGIPNFAAPKLSTINSVDVGFGDFAKIVDKFRVDAFENVQKKDKQELDQVISKFKEESQSFKHNVEEKLIVLGNKEKSEYWKFTNNSQINMALEALSNSDKVTKEIKENAKVIIKKMKELERVSKNMSKSLIVKKGAGEEVSANAKVAYDFISETIKAYSSLFNTYTHFMVKEYAQVRKAVILCGRAATKETKDEKVEESVEMEIAFTNSIMESSDIFVMEHFEYAY